MLSTGDLDAVRWLALLLAGLLSIELAATPTTSTATSSTPTTSTAIYSNDFEHAPLGKVSDDLQVANGTFAVKRVDGNTFLELTPNPLDTDGVLFGPGDATSVDVSARIWADRTGARSPEFGLGSNDVGGYRLWVWPAHGVIQLRKADDAVASKPFNWIPARWLWLRLRVRQVSATAWRIEAKAWPDGETEPKDWVLTFDDPQTPNPGKASVWGLPFSGKPLRFDDLSVRDSTP